MSKLQRTKRSLLDSDDEESEDLFGTMPKLSKAETNDTVTSEFASSLKMSGLTLDSSNDIEKPHWLRSEQALFRRKLEQSLQSSNAVDAFMEQLQKYLDDNNLLLLKALMPVRGSSDSSQDPESLVRNLLNIECLQPPLTSYLLEKLAIISLETEGIVKDDDPTTTIPKLILNSLRWLNVTQNGEHLTDKLMEIMEATPDQLQVEIVSSLPEIIPDHLHDKVAKELQKSLQKKHLTATILDTFTNLSIKSEMSLHLRINVLEGIKQAPQDDLPIMVKFVLAATNAKDCIIEIDTLRDNLSLDKDTALNMISQASQRLAARRPLTQQTKVTKNDDFDVLVLDVIRLSMTSETKISDAWFQAIDKGTLPPEQKLKVLDILILLHLYDLPNKKKLVESLVKNKIRNGKITEELIKKLFEYHSKIMRNLFEGVQNIAEMLMNSTERVLTYFSTVFQVQAFSRLDKFCQQEIIADLATQIGTNPKTRDVALATLSELAQKHTLKLAHFSLYICGFLDHVTNLTLPQVRQIMDVLSTLAYNSPKHGQTLREDLQMVIRKQITATVGRNSNLKQIGVIGAVAVVKNMCKKSSVEAFVPDDSLAESSSSGNVKNPLIKQALEMLEMIKAATKSFSSVSGLFMDELACVFDKQDDELHKELIDWISDQMANDFQEEFIVDVTDKDLEGNEAREGFLPMKLAFAIDDPALELGNIGLNLAPILFAKGGLSSAKAARLIPHFRLMSKCIMRQQDGQLDDIDAVLGCPIWMVSAETYDKVDCLSSQELSMLCDINFYCLNIFRELVNTFALSQNEEDKKKVIVRLKHILLVQEKLTRLLPQIPGYVPPLMLHLEDTVGWQSPISAPETKSKGGKKKGGLKRKAGQDLTNLPTQSQQNDTTLDGRGDESDAQAPDLDLYQPFMREFDLAVFKIFTFDVLDKGSAPIMEEEIKNPKLRPKEFLLLMKDLNKKLNHALLPCVAKKSFPGKGKSLSSTGFSNLDRSGPLKVAKFSISLMENILADAEVLAEYFKNILDLYDGDKNSPEIYKDENFDTFNQGLELVFDSLRILLSWNGMAEQVNLLKKALSYFANRLNKVNFESMKISDLATKALDYLVKMKGVILSVSTANAHLKLMETIDNLGDVQSSQLHETSKEYLSRLWFGKGKTAEKGAKFNAYVEAFLTLHIATSKSDENAREIIEDYVSHGIMELVEKRTIEEDKFVTLNKGTLSAHYKVLLSNLVRIAKKTTFSSRLGSQELTKQLAAWDSSIVIFQSLLDVIKQMASPRALLGPVLKNSRLFLDHFLKHGMPLLDKLFNQRLDDCKALLKSLQICTRYLQYVCSFSRKNSDISLASQVPLLKKSLENFLFRVKAMMAVNNVVEAFWMGNLKHRDLKGKELDSSQIIEEDDDDEIVDDPSDESDVELNSNDASENNEANGANEEEENGDSLEY